MSLRILLDTHIILSFVQKGMSIRFPLVERLLAQGDAIGFFSVASLWEIAMKTRLNKLQPKLPVDVIPQYLEAAGMTIVQIGIAHVVTSIDDDPKTRDPFDRLLLAQCQIEGLQLATIDRALIDHPLALRF